uniref:Apoptosis inhibitor 5 n=1 Tax=Ascaris lumbricoides TaxID=6252 RepID=A0A0M3HX57_ASCLU
MDTDLKSLVEDQFREIMKDVTAAEFDLIFELMRSMGAYQSAHGRAFLCKMVFEQIGMDRPFPAHDVQRFDQILYFVERAQKLFSPTCRSTDFAEFLISKGFPTLHEVTPCLKNRLLRAVAQVAPYAGTLDESTVIVVFEHFLALIPLLPSEQLDSEIDDDKDAEPQLKLSELEAVGLTMYALLKTNKNVFLSLQEQKEHYSNWPKRVLYLAGLLQQYITSATGELKALREASSTQRDREKMQFLVNALKMAENVYKICKDIVHSKPTFSLILTSSWKKSVVRTTDANPEKRKASDSSLSGEPKGKKERPAEKYYVPPGGKYSGSMTGFARGGPRDQAGFHGGRGRPRGFGRFGRY